MKAKTTQQVKAVLIQYLQEQNLSDVQINKIAELFKQATKAAIDDSQAAIIKELNSIKKYV